MSFCMRRDDPDLGVFPIIRYSLSLKFVLRHLTHIRIPKRLHTQWIDMIISTLELM